MGRLNALVGGFPCQDLSVAGKRKGLSNDDGTPTRSGLFWKILDLADAIGQRWTILENVPGLLSSGRGQDFALVVGGLAGTTISVPKNGWQNTGFALGPKGLVEWAILDAQWFGVAQRRRRVFIVRDSGNWHNRPPLFLEPSCLRGNPPPSRQAGQRPSGTISSRATGGGGLGTDFELDRGLQPVADVICSHEVAPCLETTSNDYSRADGFTMVCQDGSTCTVTSAPPAIAFAQNQLGEVRTGDVSGTLNSNGNASGRNSPLAMHQMRVRRLTPRECERLQGFPDDHTIVPHRGKPAADGPRYKAIGNSMAVPVMAWIGKRIQRIENGPE